LEAHLAIPGLNGYGLVPLFTIFGNKALNETLDIDQSSVPVLVHAVVVAAGVVIILVCPTAKLVVPDVSFVTCVAIPVLGVKAAVLV
jgi:hypothetical protein